MKKLIIPIMFIICVSFASAINIFANQNLRQNNITNASLVSTDNLEILNPPFDCILKNSWIYGYNGSSAKCANMNYTFPYLEFENQLGYIRISGENISWYNYSGDYRTMLGLSAGATGSSELKVANSLRVAGAMYSDNDISTTGSGDDFWLGTATQSAAKLQLYANGNAYMNGTVQVVAVDNSSRMMCLAVSQAGNISAYKC